MSSPGGRKKWWWRPRPFILWRRKRDARRPPICKESTSSASTTTSPSRREIDRFLNGQGIEVNITLHFDNIQMIKEAVAHRVGVSIMPARIMNDDIAQGRLMAIRIQGAELYRPLGIIHRKKKRFYPVAQAFLELLCEKPGPDFSLMS